MNNTVHILIDGAIEFRSHELDRGWRKVLDKGRRKEKEVQGGGGCWG
jgi:hypothetical protein